MQWVAGVQADIRMMIVAEEVPVLGPLIMKTVTESKDGWFSVSLISTAIFDDLLETQKGIVREYQAERRCSWTDLREQSAGRDENLTDPIGCDVQTHGAQTKPKVLAS
jgi:hypothetical protein